MQLAAGMMRLTGWRPSGRPSLPWRPQGSHGALFAATKQRNAYWFDRGLGSVMVFYLPRPQPLLLGLSCFIITARVRQKCYRSTC